MLSHRQRAKNTRLGSEEKKHTRWAYVQSNRVKDRRYFHEDRPNDNNNTIKKENRKQLPVGRNNLSPKTSSTTTILLLPVPNDHHP